MKFLLEFPTMVALWILMSPGMFWLRHQNIFAISGGIEFCERKHFFSFADIQSLEAASDRSLVEGYTTKFSTVAKHQYYTRPLLILSYATATIFYFLEGLSYGLTFLVEKGLLVATYQPSFAMFLSGFGNVSILCFFVIYWGSGLFKLLLQSKVGQESPLPIWLATAPLMGKSTKL